jgi:hypothetical protein
MTPRKTEWNENPGEHEAIPVALFLGELGGEIVALPFLAAWRLGG